MRLFPQRIWLTAVSLSAALTACSGTPQLPDVTTLIEPYRMDVRQGNFLTQDMVAKLKPGQTKDQVRFILGSPLIEDAFHSQRWDYVYRFAPGKGEVTERHFTVFFDADRLVRVGGDVVPEAGQPVSGAAQTATQRSRVIEINDNSSTEADQSGKPAQKPWWKFYE